ncbi:Protein phosphatase 1H [Frankliniella fusca]|uniref:Protein phosphatase 1H n=1 Tax=Frankliniella fusca TaxID=407009 RepID=A0AAE1I3D3_9NEOP|nr:Protein phosphatase 1H [Frankliniella fusca]
MFNKVRNALYNAVGGVEALPAVADGEDQGRMRVPKFPYARPHFLLFQQDEVQVSADHQIRPIIVPRDISKLPWSSGYAETVNAGKSTWNEDQACVQQRILVRDSEKHIQGAGMPYTYFALFDGHAGYGAAVAAANQLHNVVHKKLMDVIDHILPPLELGNNGVHLESSTPRGMSLWFPEKALPIDAFITGALELAFNEMDAQIGEDKKKYVMKGGCTCVVALFIAGKLYVANAGDSRAVRCSLGKPYPMSNDFTPSTERRRLQQLAAHKPELLSNNFTHLEYNPRPGRALIGRKILYRDVYMTGWAYKTCSPEDLRTPVVTGEGKRSRLLATIGVTRGLGDHELRSIIHNTPIKPFLSSQAEIKIYNIEAHNINESDVLVMGTDGLWDVTSNERTAEIVQHSLHNFPFGDKANAKYRFTSAAQDLVMHSRGKPEGHNWQTSGGAPGTIDDISVFVIPLAPYKSEWEAWKKLNEELHYSAKLPPSSTISSEQPATDVGLRSAVNQTTGPSDSITGPLQNGISSSTAPIEVFIPQPDDVNASELRLAEISLDAEEVTVIDPEETDVSNGESESPPASGDNADPTSPNYCER